MPRLNFGAFLAPHDPVGENPLLQFRRDLDLVEQLDKLGYDEFWCGEHHSSGWEMIGSPEMFLAAAAERSHRIKLATGVVSLPYHHPFNVAQRMVQLDWMSGGRAVRTRVRGGWGWAVRVGRERGGAGARRGWRAAPPRPPPPPPEPARPRAPQVPLRHHTAVAARRRATPRAKGTLRTYIQLT